MITTLHLIVLGTAVSSTPGAERKSLTPASSDIKRATDLAAANNINLQVHLIDPNYAPALRARTHDPDAKVIAAFGPNVEVYPGHYDVWLKEQVKAGTAPSETDDVVFITATPMSSYSIMDWVESWTLDHRWYVPGPMVAVPSGTDAQAMSITMFLSFWLPTRPQPYDFYAGSEIKGPQTTADLETIRLYAVRAANLLQHWLALGYDNPELKSSYTTPPSWMLNVEVAPIKGFIGYYGLIPPRSGTVDDRDPAMELRESGDYRRRLTFIIAATMANFAVKNRLITVEQAGISGGWRKTATWKLVQAAALAWDLTSLADTAAPSLLPGALKLASLKPPPAPVLSVGIPLGPLVLGPALPEAILPPLPSFPGTPSSPGELADIAELAGYNPESDEALALGLPVLRGSARVPGLPIPGELDPSLGGGLPRLGTLPLPE